MRRDDSAGTGSIDLEFADVVESSEAATDEALLAELRAIEADERQLAPRRSVTLTALDRRKVFAADGHASMFGMLRSMLGWSEGECRSRMRLARLIDAFVDAGELMYNAQAPVANIEAIARAHANPRCGSEIGAVIGTMLTEACRMEYADFRRIPERWEMLADADGAHRDRGMAHENRNAHVVTFQGAPPAPVNGPSSTAPPTRRSSTASSRPSSGSIGRPPSPATATTPRRRLMPRTDAQRRADALTAIFARAAARRAGSQLPEPVVNILVDHNTWSDLMTFAGLFPERNVDPFEPSPQLVGEMRCETSTGELIDPYTVLQASLEGHVRFVILDDEGVPIRWGRKRRLFSGAAREAVRTLGFRCLHPGCRVRAGRCQTDHTVEWSAGGETGPDNGGLACPRHNRWKHRHRYTVHRDRHGHWHTYRPDGSEIS